MNNLKRIVSAVLVGTMALSLVACSMFGKDDEEDIIPPSVSNFEMPDYDDAYDVIKDHCEECFKNDYNGQNSILGNDSDRKVWARYTIFEDEKDALEYFDYIYYNYMNDNKFSGLMVGESDIKHGYILVDGDSSYYNNYCYEALYYVPATNTVVSVGTNSKEDKYKNLVDDILEGLNLPTIKGNV